MTIKGMVIKCHVFRMPLCGGKNGFDFIKG